MDLAELIVRIRVAADDAGLEIDSIIGELQRFGHEAQQANNTAAMSMGAVAAASGMAFNGIVGAVMRGVSAVNEYKAAISGLQSVAVANDIGSGVLAEALDNVVDKFFTAAEASTAFKNLLARGYTIDQATQTINRLKDAASFGRQASMKLGEAVVSATEGIKQENSILVDNAGVTKNVAKMWQDYAREIGTTTDKLTQQQKVEAEYQGIMKETAAQLGDLQKLGEGLAGVQAESEALRQGLSVSFGDALSPIIQGGTEMFNILLGGMKSITEEAPMMTAGITASATAMTGLVAASAGLKTIKTLMTGIGMAASTLGPLALVAVAIGLAAGAYASYKKHIEDAERTERERIAGLKESIKAEQERIGKLEQLGKRYTELSKKSTLSVEEASELVGIRLELAAAYGIEAAAVRNAADAHDELAAAIAEEKAASLEKTYDAQNEVTWKALHAAEEATISLLTERNDLQAEYNSLKNGEIDLNAKATDKMVALGKFFGGRAPRFQKIGTILEDLRKSGETLTVGEVLTKAFGAEKVAEVTSNKLNFGEEVVAKVKEELEEVQGELESTLPLFETWFTEHFAQMVMEIPEDVRKNLPDGFMAEVLGGILKDFMDTPFEEIDDFSQIEAAFRAQLAAVKDVANSPEATNAIGEIQNVRDAALKGFTPTDEQLLSLSNAWDTMLGAEGAMVKALTTLHELLGGDEDATRKINELITSMLDLPEGFEVFTGAGMEIAQTGDAMAKSVAEGAKQMQEAAKAAIAGADGFDYMNASAKAWEKQQGTLIAQSNTLIKQYEDGADKQAIYTKGMEALQKAQKAGAKLTAADEKAILALRKELDATDDTYQMLAQRTKNAAAKLNGEMENMAVQANDLSADFGRLAASARIREDVQINTAAAEKALSGLMAIAKGVLAVLKALGVISGDTSVPSGGGGGKKDKEEEARKKAEEARKEAIRKDYEMIAHKRHMNEITLDMELAMLEEIRRAHRLTAEEIMEWEEKIYDVKKEIRDRDAGSIDKVGDGLIQALEGRYQAMLDAEIDRLDKSRNAWSEWRDESVKAIEDQIAAIEALAKTEDREKQDQEELRKIAKLRQDIEFEQDEYNRMKLQQQLDQAISSREDRLRRQALDDQKDALREQISAIQERAEAEIDALDKEQEAIEKAYQEQMKGAALRAEAEQMLMQNNQQEIINLIGEFAPEYNALGKTLGEKLLEGFQSKVGNIVSWMEGLNNTLAGIQEGMAAEALAAARELQSGYTQRQNAEQSQPPAVIVEQTNNFNVEVETPRETALRIQQANEELGALMYGG